MLFLELKTSRIEEMDYFLEKLKFQLNFIMHKADLSRLNISGKKP